MPPLATTAAVAGSLGPLSNPVTLLPVNPANQQAPVTEEGTRDPRSGTYVNTQGPSGQQTERPPDQDTPRPPSPIARHALAIFTPAAESQPTNTGVRLSMAGPEAADPGGIALASGDPQRGNSFRLMPEPWDSPLYTAVQGAEGGIA